MIEPTTIALSLARILVLVLGLGIAYLSYRAYKRTGNPYLRQASIGFTIVAIGIFLEGVLFEVLGLDLVTVHIIESLVIAVGFAVILYSLIR